MAASFFDTMPQPGLAVALAATSFTSELVFAVTSFGPAVVLNVGWQICFMLHLGNGTMCVLRRPVGAHMSRARVWGADLAGAWAFGLWRVAHVPRCVLGCGMARHMCAGCRRGVRGFPTERTHWCT